MLYEFPIEAIKKICQITKTSGDFKGSITGIASTLEAQAGDLSFIANKKYAKDLPNCKASLVLIPSTIEATPKPNQTFLLAKDPSAALSQLCAHIEKDLFPKPKRGIHPSAIIEDSATVHPSAHIGPQAYIGHNASIGEHSIIGQGSYIGPSVTIGEHCHLFSQVRIHDYCELHDYVRIHSGVVIGADGFGYQTFEGVHEKIPQVGRVVIESHVEIGANTTIDRARFNTTKIGQGTKIDNLVQIAHNVQIGQGCLIASQTGIAGSSTLGNYVVLAGQVGVGDHVHIADKSIVTAQTGVNKDLKPGSFVKGTPCEDYATKMRLFALQRRLPEFFERLKNLENTQPVQS